MAIKMIKPGFLKVAIKNHRVKDDEFILCTDILHEIDNPNNSFPCYFARNVDNAIAGIKELYTEWENSTDDAKLESNPFGAVLNIIQRNIGE